MMKNRMAWVPISVLIIVLLVLSSCTTTESLSTTDPEEINSLTSSGETSNASATESQSSTQETGTIPNTSESQTPEGEETKRISTWVMAGEPARGFKGEPSEQFFISELVDIDHINSKGGRLTFKMNPVVDPSCVQTFKVGWEFDFDVKTVHEGQTINVTVFNGEGLADCYKNAKAAMTYGGEVVIDLKPPGSSHFLDDEPYKKYHEGHSQYLFAISDQTGMVRPPGSIAPAASSTGAIFVKDGIYNTGEIDAPYGNFSFTISAGSVFTYTVTYLYEAVVE